MKGTMFQGCHLSGLDCSDIGFLAPEVRNSFQSPVDVHVYLSVATDSGVCYKTWVAVLFNSSFFPHFEEVYSRSSYGLDKMAVSSFMRLWVCAVSHGHQQLTCPSPGTCTTGSNHLSVFPEVLS